MEVLIVIVWFVEILLWFNGNNIGRVNGFMVVVIVVMDMWKIYCFGDIWYLVDVVQEIVQIEVIIDVLFIVFKMGYIYWVEVYQSGLEVNVGFCQLIVCQIVMLVEDLFQLFQ